jgi:hypothetical protein
MLSPIVADWPLFLWFLLVQSLPGLVYVSLGSDVNFTCPNPRQFVKHVSSALSKNWRFNVEYTYRQGRSKRQYQRKDQQQHGQLLTCRYPPRHTGFYWSLAKAALNKLMIETYIEPIIQNKDAIWILDLREYLSAINEEDRAPTSEPKGIAQVMPPCL